MCAGNLAPRAVCPPRSMGLGEICIHKLKARDKATFSFLTEAWAMPAPSSKKSEERELVVDSGASMRMPHKKISVQQKWKPFVFPETLTTVITQRGSAWYCVAPARQTGVQECSGLHMRPSRTSGRSRLFRRCRAEEASVSRS